MDLTTRIPLDPKVWGKLASKRDAVEAVDLIGSYKVAQQLPSNQSVDLCAVVKGAGDWKPTANTNSVPLYVAMAPMLDEKSRTQCTAVTSGLLPLDKKKTGAILFEFAPASGTFPLGSEFASYDFQARALSEQARGGLYPGALSIGEPSAYYVKDLLHTKSIKPTYRMNDPDRYLLVDLAFTLHNLSGVEYQSAKFLIQALSGSGEILAHAMMPD